MKIIKKCLVCEKEFGVVKSRERQTTCSRVCSGLHQWKDSQDRKEKMSSDMSKLASTRTGEKNAFYGKTHSDKTLEIISKKSASKFEDAEFTEKYRKTMTDRGHWRKKEDVPPYTVYAKNSDWIQKMWDIVDIGCLLLTEHGVFNTRTNRSGVVRDHIYGRKNGFQNDVYYEIMRHPANCQIITHRENVSKAQKGRNCDSSISLEELFYRIENYSEPWIEQDECIALINKYRSGIKLNIME